MPWFVVISRGSLGVVCCLLVVGHVLLFGVLVTLGVVGCCS